MKISLQQSLFLGFCAVFIVLTRVGLRLHLGISGHAMLFTIFFLMLARACVSHRLAASYTGVLAGVIAMALGIGQGGPLILTKFLFPALVIDGACALRPRLLHGYAGCATLAVAAAATKFLSIALTDWLVGMDTTVLAQHAALKSAAAVVFGLLGGLLVPPVVRGLKARGVIRDAQPSLNE